jgi:hypothetical protein
MACKSAPSMTLAKLGAGVVLALFAGCYSDGGRLDHAEQAGCAISDFKVDGSIGAHWNGATGTLAYGRAGADGHFQAWLSDGDGNHERRLAFGGWPEGRHQFVVEWHPSGKYLFVEVEKAEHPGSSDDAIPGYGAYTDLWLVTPDGARAWKLVEEPDDYDHALTHAVITRDGTRFAWTERVKAPDLGNANLYAGAYVFNVADFVDGDPPRLANTRAWKPLGAEQGGEVDGISDDGKTLAFYSTVATHDLFASRIYLGNIDGGPLVELSSDSFSQAPKPAPGGGRIVYMSGSGADLFSGEVQGADWWSVNPDGSGRRRLTFMNQRNGPQSVNHYRLAGVVSFDSSTSFYGDVLTYPFGLHGKIVRVTCDGF